MIWFYLSLLLCLFPITVMVKFLVSHSSRKDIHFLLISELKSGTSKSDVLKSHLLGGLICAWELTDWETWACSLTMIEWMRFSRICLVSDLLTRKRPILEDDWWEEEKYKFSLDYRFLILQLFSCNLMVNGQHLYSTFLV